MAPLASLSLTAVGLLSCISSVHATHQHAEHARLHEKRLLFDPLTTPIDVSGVHKWKAPGAGDQRGPCPGLNALANHNYIPHDGVVSLLEVIPVINSVYGLGLDIGTLLATLGVVFGGAPVSLSPKVSIGGEDPAVSNLLNGLLGLSGMPQGLNLTHNLIEADSSPTRDDLYVTGDAWTMNMDHFNELKALIPEKGSIGLNKLSNFAVKRYHQSVKTNPYFYYGPFSGFIARNAAYLFIGNLLSNHSSAHPAGRMNEETLKSFFGVTGEGSKMVYNYGHERIPENWYRRPVDYTLVQFNLDLLKFTARHPVLANIGANTGTVNSFTGVDLENLTGGVLNVQTLLQGNNLLCFALQIVKLAAPNWTNNLFTTLTKPLELILDAVSTPLLSLDCPNWTWLQAGGHDILDELKKDQKPGTDFFSA